MDCGAGSAAATAATSPEATGIHVVRCCAAHSAQEEEMLGMLSSAGVDVAPVEVHKLNIDFSATAPAGVYYALVNGASAGSMAA
jgi:hypothetical protein